MARPIDGNSYVGGEDNYSDREDIQVQSGVRKVATDQDIELSRAGVGRRPDDVGKARSLDAIEGYAWYIASQHDPRLNSDRCPNCGRDYDREEDFSNVGGTPGKV